jgi:inner membrane protein
VIVFDNYQEHLSVALIIGIALDYFLLDFALVELILFYPALLLGALYPDIDTPNSFLGHRFNFISEPIFECIGHRTITHSIFIMTIMFIIATLLWGINAILAGFTLGFLSHILGDLTNGKVQILYPMSKKKFGKRLYGIEK